MSILVIFQQMIVIFLLVLVGYILFKKKILSYSCSADLSVLVVHLCSPALILGSALEGCHNLKYSQMLAGFVLCGILYAVLILCGIVLPKILRAEEWEVHQYKMMTIFGNTGFIGIPVTLAVLGSESVIYVTIFNIYFNLLIYTYGMYLVNKGAVGKKQNFTPKMFLNVGNLSNVAAVLVFILKPDTPAILEEFVNYIGNATVFLSMVIVGGFLVRAPLKETFSERKVYLFVLIRQILIPILLVLLLKRWVKDPIMLGACILMVSMPVANLPLMMAEQAGADGRILSKGIIVTTLCAIFTIPLTAVFM